MSKAKLHIESAAKKNSTHDLSRQHLTTMDFGQVQPIFHEECIARDAFNIKNISVFARLAPLVIPSFGKVNVHMVPIFVPYHQVYQYFDAWKDGKKADRGKSAGVLYITQLQLHHWLGSDDSPFTEVVEDEGKFDLELFSLPYNDVPTKFRLTRKGRFLFKVLRSLGYQIVPASSIRVNNVPSPSRANEGPYRLSVMPLLAFCKAYNDYFTLNSSYDVSPLTKELELFRQYPSASPLGTNVWDYSALGSIRSLLEYLFDDDLALSALFANDYFTCAWQQPFAPSALFGQSQQVTSFEPPFATLDYYTEPDKGELTSSGDGVFLRDASDSVTGFSAYGVRMLQAFDAIVRRNNYAGTKTVERVLSRFGIKIDDYKVFFAHVLQSTSSVPLQIGDVTSTSDTASAVLGDYAGKGIVSGGVKSLNFKATDFGILFYLAWISPEAEYGDSVDRATLKLDPFDYYQPEFDGKGPQAISQMELSAAPNHHFLIGGGSMQPSDSVFGFTERYNEYRGLYPRNQITGDFLLGTKESMTPWHFNRSKISDLQQQGLAYAQSRSFSVVSPLEYTRIFQQDEVNADHFFFCFRFDVKASRPILSLSSATELGEGNLEFEKNGNNLG